MKLLKRKFKIIKVWIVEAVSELDAIEQVEHKKHKRILIQELGVKS